MNRPRVLAIGVALAIALAGCSGGSGSATTDGTSTPTSAAAGPLRLLTHDSFVVSDSVLAAFTKRTGIDVEVITGGDAGEMVNKAILSAGNPEADVLFGIDTTLLSRAVDAGVFAPYTATDIDAVSAPFRDDTAGGTVTPIDYGDVCVNIDDLWYADNSLPLPSSLDALAERTADRQLVVENPATSSPGLAFMLATIVRYGEDGWLDYWQRLKDNNVLVVNGWTEAYTGLFTAGGGNGERPMVVSYASSPPAEIVYAADPKPKEPRTSVMLDGCFRQVEYAGVLAGTPREAEARALVDFMLSPEFQADVPLSMFVFPVREGTPLPEVFRKFAGRPTEPLTMPAADIAENRERWVEQWTELMLG